MTHHQIVASAFALAFTLALAYRTYRDTRAN
jgi:hypothetical protein